MTNGNDTKVIDLDVERIIRMTTRAELVSDLSRRLERRGLPPELAEELLRKLEQLTRAGS